MLRCRLILRLACLAATLAAATPALAHVPTLSGASSAAAMSHLFGNATARRLSDLSIVLRGVITDPRSITRFRFEYHAFRGRTHDTSWLHAPRSAAPIVVITRLSGLPAHTTYHFRLAIRYRTQLKYGRTLTVSTSSPGHATTRATAPAPAGSVITPVPAPVVPTRAAAPVAAAKSVPVKTNPGHTTTAATATTAATTTTAATAMTAPTIVAPPTTASATTTTASPTTASATTATAPGTTVTTPAPTTSPTISPSPTVAPTIRSLLWGAQIGTQLTGGKPPWDMTAATAFSSMVGKAPAILPFNIPFVMCGSTCTWYPFPTNQMNTIRQYGSIPMLNWSSMSSPLSATEPNFTLAAVARGDFDSYLRTFAASAAAWGHPFFLRFNWEMNGNWFPWAEGGNSNRPGDFVSAWRHVHDIFTAAGASNVSWVWCPSVVTTNATINLQELYPGDGYVNWTGMDGYNWGGLGGGAGGWQSFANVFSTTYSKITTTVAPTKPIMIGEAASTEAGGSKAAWISDMFSSVTTQFPQIKALIWFESFDGAYDWPVESSSVSLAAFTRGVADPRFASNTYADLSGTTISPP